MTSSLTLFFLFSIVHLTVFNLIHLHGITNIFTVKSVNRNRFIMSQKLLFFQTQTTHPKNVDLPNKN